MAQFEYKCFNDIDIFTVLNQLKDGEYTHFGFGWYLNHNGSIYRVSCEQNVFSQQTWIMVRK